MSPTEGRVLAALLKRAPAIVTHEGLRVALFAECESANILTVFVTRIRKKIPAWLEITTVHGEGYYVNTHVARRFEAWAKEQGVKP